MKPDALHFKLAYSYFCRHSNPAELQHGYGPAFARGSGLQRMGKGTGLLSAHAWELISARRDLKCIPLKGLMMGCFLTRSNKSLSYAFCTVPGSIPWAPRYSGSIKFFFNCVRFCWLVFTGSVNSVEIGNMRFA